MSYSVLLTRENLFAAFYKSFKSSRLQLGGTRPTRSAVGTVLGATIKEEVTRKITEGGNKDNLFFYFFVQFTIGF